MLAVIIAILVVMLSVALYIKNKQSGSQESSQTGPATAAATGRPGPQGARRGARMRRPVEAVEDEDAGNVENQELQELEAAGIKIPEGKIGKKKMEKLQQKADKKKVREAEEREREEKKRKQLKEDEERQREAEQERLKEEEEKRIREEKERQDHEAYLKLKASFNIEEEGFDEDPQEMEGDSAENKLRMFVDYIRKNKIVLLEDLAAHFKMKTQDTIDRVHTLQEDGILTGVVDDRGKFIYISNEELQEVAKFIRQRGRVSISELAENSNKLIHFNSQEIQAS